MDRPCPPEELADGARHPELFTPAPDVEEWVWGTFITEGAPLFNPDHLHLCGAKIGVLWTNVPNSRQMRTVVGTAELAKSGQGNKWQKARAEFQLRAWFGGMPDFLLTLDADYCARASDVAFCALVEHELYHCAQQTDGFGSPKFTRDGDPVYGIRGHDVEEFVGVVRRYGPVGANVRALTEAALREPEVDAADIEGACGTCGRMVR